MSAEPQIRNHATFIWSVADKLRGVYKQSEYGRVILPLVVLRRLDCVLEPTKAEVLARYAELKGHVENVGPVLEQITGIREVYNTSPLDFRRLLDDPANVAGNLRSYIAGFSPAARDVLEKFRFDVQIVRMERANLLYLVVSQFAEIDLHPETVSNLEMGYLYEELVRRFSELSNETAGEHFTPREVIRLMVDLLFVEDEDVLRKRGIVKTLYDPACGTGGMLSVAEDYLRDLNPDARLEVFGQELNEETYAICRSDMMLKGQDASHIVQGNSFDADGHGGRTFDYMLANPPFGVEWKPVERAVKDERERLGFNGRFGAGLPPINDGSFLFLQHMISKMKPAAEGGSRLAIVFNGSPLFTGAAGSGPSEIRRWIVENDWLEAVVALPDQLFYNTGISTYFWVVTNRKSAARRGKVQLVDARELWVKMRKSLGEKRKQISPEQIEEITRLYGAFEENERVKVFPNESFGYQRITVERPLRLRFAGDGARERLEASKAFAKLGEEQRAGLVDDRRCARRARNDGSRGGARRRDGGEREAPEGRGEGALRGAGRARPGSAGARRARPGATRPGERPAAGRAGDVRSGSGRAAREQAVPAGGRRVHGGRGAAVRAGCLGRPREDEDRLRDPADSALLQVRAAKAARGDRRGDSRARGGDSGAAGRGDAVIAPEQSRRLKHFLELNDSGVWGDEPDGEDDATVLRSTDIALDGSWAITDPAKRSIAPDDRRGKTLIEGDLVVVTSSGSAAHLGKTARVTREVAELQACFSNFVQRLRANEQVESRYVFYVLNSTYGASQLEMLGTTTTGLRNLNGSILGAVRCPALPATQQREIADFLDAETARIDALIEKKRRMIAAPDIAIHC